MPGDFAGGVGVMAGDRKETMPEEEDERSMVQGGVWYQFSVRFQIADSIPLPSDLHFVEAFSEAFAPAAGGIRFSSMSLHQVDS